MDSKNGNAAADNCKFCDGDSHCKFNIQYDSVSLHALHPPVCDPLPSHLIDNVNLLLKLQVSSDVREEREDVPCR